MRILAPSIKNAKAIWQFSRPHTVVGTSLSIASLQATYGNINDISGLTSLLLPSLCANLFITGLNQITDYEIDIINKPQLPLPAKTLSPKKAYLTILIALVGSIYTAKHNQTLLVTTLISEVIGILYSLKPFRWKRNPYLAALAIILVRGPVVNIGFPLSIGKYFSMDPVIYFSIFSIAIALMKDMPDIEGDKQNGINTFSVMYGSTRIRKYSEILLGVLFLVASLKLHNWIFTFFFSYFWIYLKTRTMENVYMSLWKLFYTSYILLPFAM